MTGRITSNPPTYADIGPWQRYVDFVHDLAAEDPTTETESIIAAAGDILMDLPNRDSGSASIANERERCARHCDVLAWMMEQGDAERYRGDPPAGRRGGAGLRRR